MASSQVALSESSLKAPAVEIVGLLSDKESDDEVKQPLDRDALAKEGESEEDGEEEQWESESLYEDALEGLGDEHLTGEGNWINRARTFRWEIRVNNTCRHGGLHAGGGSRFPQTFARCRRGPVHHRYYRSWDHHREEVMHSLWHPPTFVLGGNTRQRLLPSSGPWDLPRAYQAGQATAIQHSR